MKKIQTKIVTIGGGRSEITVHIDTEIVKLTKKKTPQLLFIPTASSDDPEYVDYIKKQYVDLLGCKMNTLLLLQQKYSKQEIEKLIFKADIIYVGGGNTLMMMRKWRKLGLDKMLKTAWVKGKVMCGLSAGSICWHESGHSDSMHYYDSKNWDYIRVHCLNFLPFTHCPHYDSQTGGKKRKDDFKQMMKKYPGQIGIACEDGVAIEYINDRFKVLSQQSSKNAYRVYWHKGNYFEEKLKNKEKFLPLKSLIKLK